LTIKSKSNGFVLVLCVLDAMMVAGECEPPSRHAIEVIERPSVSGNAAFACVEPSGERTAKRRALYSPGGLDFAASPLDPDRYRRFYWDCPLPASMRMAEIGVLRRPAVWSAAQTVGQPAGELSQTFYETHNDYRDILSSSQPALSFSLAMTSSTSQPRPIVIIGAGIIGLSTAVRVLQSRTVQKQGIPVHVIADHLPADPLDPMYASTIAGAHHLSFADDGDARQRRWDSASASRAVMTADSQPCAS